MKYYWRVTLRYQSEKATGVISYIIKTEDMNIVAAAQQAETDDMVIISIQHLGVEV